MNGRLIQNAVLAGSLLVNAMLVGGMLWLASYTRETVLDMTADCAESKFSLQKHILREIESNDKARIEEIKKTLRFNIDKEGRISYRVRTQPGVK